MKTQLRLRRAAASLAALLALPACQGAMRTAESPGNGSLSDAHVAGVALVINNIESGYAMLAPDRSGDPDVLAYATRMRTDHASLNETLTTALGRLDLSAHDDPAGIALRDASIARRELLSALRGPAFDAAYVDADIQSHREMLDVVDRLLSPSAGQPALREYIVALRPVLAAHIAHAEQLRATVAARRR